MKILDSFYSRLKSSSYDQGAVVRDGGTLFSVYSENASSIRVEIYKNNDDTNPEIYPLQRQSKFMWRVFVPGVGAGKLYGYRVDGSFSPENGLRYNKNKLLIDPYAKAVSSEVVSTELTNGYKMNDPNADLSFDDRDDSSTMPKSVVFEDNFDWKGVEKPLIPWNDLVIYETHVKGLTKLRPDIDESIRGTFLALYSDQMINYLKDLGINAVELLPIHQRIDSYVFNGATTKTYWGYNTINYFSPEITYSAGRSPGDQINEFKNVVKKFHENGMEVILDVVYNHTAEGNQLGPTMSFRGIDNPVYYKLAADKRYYVDFTGVGNTINIKHPQVLKLITDSLRYWAIDMQVDGFRFDLASVLGRKRSAFDPFTSLFDIIHTDPVLSSVKLIAEPWDIGIGGYQLGNFPLDWAEWNGKYRDSVRHYWKGHGRNLSEFATRFSGSSDLFEWRGKTQYSSVNFITCHDGFTLNDLVSYSTKHNEENNEGNKDGTDNNISENMGFEGQTDSPAVLKKRNTRIRTFLITLLTSQGTPMILGGDEIKRTQNGNNNAYKLDNETSWYDWNIDEDKGSLLEFTKRIISIRRRFCVLRQDGYLKGSGKNPDAKQIAWLKSDGNEMTESDWHVKRGIGILLICTKCEHNGCEMSDLLLAFNPTAIPLKFSLPSGYSRFILLISSQQIRPEDERDIGTQHIVLEPGSAYVLKAVK